MPVFLIEHRHTAADCDTAFAAWSGFPSPLRHVRVPSTCLAGGHAVWWQVEAPSGASALALLPPFVRERSTATRCREVETP